MDPRHPRIFFGDFSAKRESGFDFTAERSREKKFIFVGRVPARTLEMRLDEK